MTKDLRAIYQIPSQQWRFQNCENNVSARTATATQEFIAFWWLINSLIIKANRLKLGDLTKFNTSFHLLKSICEYQDAFCQQTSMLKRQIAASNEVSKNPAIELLSQLRENEPQDQLGRCVCACQIFSKNKCMSMLPRGLFLKHPETFRVFSRCHNSLHIFATAEISSHQTSQSSWFLLH